MISEDISVIRLNRDLLTQTWFAAAVQAFLSVGAGQGVHLTFASYNKFNHRFFK
jgi:SNF family Na+-dependent transporter